MQYQNYRIQTASMLQSNTIDSNHGTPLRNIKPQISTLKIEYPKTPTTVQENIQKDEQYISKTDLTDKKNSFYFNGQTPRTKFSSSEIKLVNIIQKIFFKKTRYIFQILKQFYLFPDDSLSQTSILSTYDPLIFHDHAIHSLFKILETKYIERNIQAFINIKIIPYLKTADKIGAKLNLIQKKFSNLHKKQSFSLIHEVAQNFISFIIDEKVTESKQIQTISPVWNQNNQSSDIMQQKRKYIALKSKLINQNIKSNPTIKAQPVYKLIDTREVYQPINQYLPPFEQMKKQPIIIQNYISIPTGHLSSNPNRNPQTKPQQQNIKEKKSPKKYNIIYYNERPRQQQIPILTVSQKVICSYPVNANCCPGINCCEPYNNQKQVYRYPNVFSETQRNEKSDTQNETCLTQNARVSNGSKTVKIIQKSINVSSELIELQSRIQYLGFLRNLVEEQQQEEFDD